MNDRSYSDCVSDILAAIDYIEADTAGHDSDSFRADRKAAQLVKFNMGIISEASRRLPESCKAQEAAIPWRRIADFGNVLRHEYGRVELDEVWNICREHLPPLKAAVLRMQRRLRQP